MDANSYLPQKTSYFEKDFQSQKKFTYPHMISDPLAIICVLSLVVFVSIWLENHVSIFKKLGAAIMTILLALTLSNTGLIPGESPAYDFLMDTVVSAAIILILLGVDIKTILTAGPAMFKGFGIGAIGTAIGAMTMSYLLTDIIGGETWKLAGLYTGTYVGGGVNFAAVQRELNVSPDLFNAALAADVLITAFWLMVCLTVPLLFDRNGIKKNAVDNKLPIDEPKENLEKKLLSSIHPVTLINIAGLLTLTLGIIWASKLVEIILPGLSEVLVLTTLALVCGQLKPVKKLIGSSMLGNYLLLLFFAGNGAKSVVANIIEIGPGVFYFALGTVLIHGIVILSMGRLFKIKIPTLMVASQANVGGSASAIALASTRGYVKELGPGVAAGLLGYMIGNFLGLGVATVMQGVL